MIYEWRCPQCSMISETTGTIAVHDQHPDVENHKTDCTHEEGKLNRIISRSNPDFETMRDKGILERLEKFT